jgi:hypothetical protein
LLRLNRAGELAQLGDYVTAVAEADTLAGKPAAAAAVYRGAGGVYCVASEAVRRDLNLSQTERHQRGEQYADRTVRFLAKAGEAGYFKSAADIAPLKNRRNFAPLRAREDFKKLVSELEANLRTGASDGS